MEILEEKVRRSSRLKDTSAYREFLTYASLVSDEDEVYSFMEQNKIGINQPQFWLAKLTLLKNKCQYKEFMNILKETNHNQELKKHPKYWLIDELAKQLQKYLQRMLRNKARNKRSVREYQVLHPSNIEKSTRKFGKIEVYVDPDCRMQYRLEDLIEFVTKRLAADCEMEKNCYIRQVNKRPLSFLGKKNENIEKISVELKATENKADRYGNARKTNGRLSLIGRKSNKEDLQPIVQTPDFKKKSISKENPNKKSYNHLDSIQILKNITKRRSILNSQKTKIYYESTNPQKQEIYYTASVKKQKIRTFPTQQHQQQIYSEPVLHQSIDSLFSFGDQNKICSSEIKTSHKKSKERYSIRNILNRRLQTQEQVVKENQNDIAFIEETQPQIQQQFHKGSQTNLCFKISKESFELQNVIKQIQMQKYQTQTLSQIDSNKENILSGEEDIFSCGFEDGIKSIQIQGIKSKRNKFESLRKDKDSNPSESQGEGDQSSRQIYQQLIDGLKEDQSHKKKQNEIRLSVSDNKKRISRISQERSYSYSEVTSSRRRRKS